MTQYYYCPPFGAIHMERREMCIVWTVAVDSLTTVYSSHEKNHGKESDSVLLNP